MGHLPSAGVCNLRGDIRGKMAAAVNIHTYTQSWREVSSNQKREGWEHWLGTKKEWGPTQNRVSIGW